MYGTRNNKKLNVNYVVTPYISVLHDFPILVSLRVKGDSIGAWYDKNKQQISIIKSGFVGQDFGNVVKTLIAPKEASFLDLLQCQIGIRIMKNMNTI